MITFCIFTRKQMYTIEAAYFKADEIGVMFFNDEDQGIGFIPSVAIEFIKTKKGGGTLTRSKAGKTPAD